MKPLFSTAITILQYLLTVALMGVLVELHASAGVWVAGLFLFISIMILAKAK